MDLRKAFISSTVGWRVFVLYMLAAGLPVALLALLSNDAVDAVKRRALVTTLSGNAKSAALLTVDRLRVAQQHLDTRIAQPVAPPANRARNAGSEPPRIEAAARVSASTVATASVGRLGPAQLGELLSSAVAGDARDLLAVVPSAGRGHRASIVIAQPLGGSDWHIGVVNPDFLWQDTGDLPPGMWACVLGPAHEVLFCSEEGADARALAFLRQPSASGTRREDAEQSTVSREVFLSGLFAAGPWTAVAGVSQSGTAPAELIGSTPLLLVAAAGILIAALLSLTQIRRMLVPLERLTDGAKALSAGDFRTRIAVTSRDEFEQLASSFNDMAAELERQFVELQTLASHDSLTGLLNRHGLREALQTQIERCRRSGDEFALLYIDIDRFKGVNDSLGHPAGDRVLQLVAERCARVSPPSGVLARPAGDEFVLMLCGEDRDRAAGVARGLCSELAVPIAVAETTFFLGASIGVAIYPHDGESVDALIRSADIAMYRSKQRGSGHVTAFDKRFDTEAQHRHWVERDLRSAVARRELRLHFQPRLQAKSGAMTSVEALLRWQHPVRGLIGPADFVPVAEESDLILELGDWVIDNACRQARQWRDMGLDSLRVALNVSVPQLRRGTLDEQLLQCTHKWGIPPSCIEIEITESVLATDVDNVGAVLTRLRAAGITVAIDDFGTGFSSLAYLRQFPFDILKIDRAFVMDLDEDMTARAVAQSIVALGKALHKRIVAEGVETAGQAKWLTAIGCDELQGHYHGQPVEAGALTERLVGSVAPTALR